MSTRADILEALGESEGLTLPELAEFCPACDHDEQVVGNMIAILHREKVIHAAPELRKGLKVWVFGKEPGEIHEAPISLAGTESKPRSATSEAARAIAGMRQDSTRTRAHAAPSVKHPALTFRAKIEAALREHGPMRGTDIEKHVDEKRVSSECSTLLARKILTKVGGNRRGTIYGLPGQTLKDRKVEEQQTAKGCQPAPLSRGANGGGGAVTPAAGPATAEHPDIELAFGSLRARELYKAALLDLQQQRGTTQVQIESAQEQLAKIDRAIDAMRELA